MSILTASDVSRLLRISKQQVLKLTKEGRIPCFNTGVGTQRIHPRYSKEVIERIMKGEYDEENNRFSKTASQGRSVALCNLSEREESLEKHKDEGQETCRADSGKNSSKTPIAEELARKIIELESSERS